ncbi:hypothetical protein V5E97_26190 [Singulisphaera sp. Ch08]|uniref:Uncharacterized protein n=1 Tax=Singulisphaera sp. Ch08 TaxID=3120278 RepID=A0AAU7C9M8_9BACT
MKLGDIITLANNRSLPILKMKGHEQQFFACILTALKCKSRHLYVKDFDGIVIFSYLDTDDDERIQMLQSLAAHSGTILDCIFTMPSDREMTGVFENAKSYSLFSLYDELIHCWLFDFKKK